MFRQDALLDLAFQALADPSRRAMVDRLAQGPATVSELAGPLAMSLPGVMQHLRVLEASGLVVSEKVGRVRTCWIERRMGQNGSGGTPAVEKATRLDWHFSTLKELADAVDAEAA